MLGGTFLGLEWGKRTLGGMLEEQAVRFGDRVFLYFGDQQISYRELNEQANRVANGFLKLEVKKGDKVGQMMPNCPEFLYTWFGLGKIGAVEVPVNTALRGRPLQHVINQSDMEILVIHQDFLEHLAFVQDELPKLRHAVIFSTKPLPSSFVKTVKFASTDFRELLDSSPEAPGITVEPSDPAVIVFTSGTTGPAKGVVLPHHYLYFTGITKVKARRTGPDDVMYTCLPLFHINAAFSTVMTALVGDARVALGTRFSASNFWREVIKYGATEAGIVGTIGNMLLRQAEKPEDRAHRVRMIHGGGGLSPEQRKEFERRFNVWNPCGFGMTECSACASVPYEERGRKPQSSAGKPLDEYEMKIVDENDCELPRGQVGELVIRPKYPYSMIMEYYKMPEKTLEAFGNLWFHTGDYLYQDEDDYLYFVGRKKDAIRRRGEMISALEVERVIDSHPAVEESAVIGVPSELGDEDVMAFVKLKAGQQLAPAELLVYCEPRMAYFMIPRYVAFVDHFSKTETRKIEKEKLRNIGVTGSTWDREKAGYQVHRSGGTTAGTRR